MILSPVVGQVGAFDVQCPDVFFVFSISVVLQSEYLEHFLKNHS